MGSVSTEQGGAAPGWGRVSTEQGGAAPGLGRESQPRRVGWLQGQGESHNRAAKGGSRLVEFSSRMGVVDSWRDSPHASSAPGWGLWTPGETHLMQVQLQDEGCGLLRRPAPCGEISPRPTCDEQAPSGAISCSPAYLYERVDFHSTKPTVHCNSHVTNIQVVASIRRLLQEWIFIQQSPLSTATVTFKYSGIENVVPPGRTVRVPISRG